ncbi:DUF3253 domain-containing protein [Xanthomonas fragariae]|uniref:DUF3253 domain-containing protein n=1 Tax=Xanthomonas fragariae TaxID=48664 RepID=A0ABY1RJI5_9XANT|nr:DUF3253 domain-containing protein [Xanthomonas fragariae]WIY72567.1 DUF3253 domain-containing protein [Xanthomonas fragariae]SMQ97425.1 hypothetical protein PD885_00153 [Xanthomonas fragariae]
MQQVDDTQIAAVMRALLAHRLPERSICPSEVARAINDDATTWRGLMPQVRTVATDLARKDIVRITQQGDVADLDTARGPIRLMRGSHFE